MKIRKVFNKTGAGYMLDSSQIMEKTFHKMPKDAYTYMSVVRDDLRREGFNYVIGVANFKSRTGVFSIARYDHTWKKCEPSQKVKTEVKYPDKDKFDKMVAKSLKVLCHEVTHTFNFPHCSYYECLMNGSATFDEGIRKPMYLCPVCLRNLQSMIGFDII